MKGSSSVRRSEIPCHLSARGMRFPASSCTVDSWEKEREGLGMEILWGPRGSRLKPPQQNNRVTRGILSGLPNILFHQTLKIPQILPRRSNIVHKAQELCVPIVAQDKPAQSTRGNLQRGSAPFSAKNCIILSRQNRHSTTICPDVSFPITSPREENEVV